jgi:hypothetical protein
VFVSSGFRTAFGQDETQVEEENKHEAPKSEEGSDEHNSESQESSGNLQAGSGEQEVKGKLQVDPDSQIRTELLESEEVGEVETEKKNADVEDVPHESETEQSPDRPRSGNLDTWYGKRSLCTIAGK